MPRNGNRAARLPSYVARLGHHQISVSLTTEEAEAIEAYRRQHGLRSWNEAIRELITQGMRRG